MRLIDRLDRNDRDSEDAEREQTPEAGADADENADTPLFDSGSQAADEAGPDREDPDFKPIAGSSLDEDDPRDQGAYAKPIGELTPPPPSRRTTRNQGPRPLKEGLRKGLSEERVWLQIQREELERERAGLVAEIEAEMAEIETQIGHIDALLGNDASGAGDTASPGGQSAPFPAPLQRTG